LRQLIRTSIKPSDSWFDEQLKPLSSKSFESTVVLGLPQRSSLAAVRVRTMAPVKSTEKLFLFHLFLLVMSTRTVLLSFDKAVTR